MSNCRDHGEGDSSRLPRVRRWEVGFWNENRPERGQEEGRGRERKADLPSEPVAGST